MSLLTAPMVKVSYILAGVYFIFLKRHSGVGILVFRCGIWASVKGSGGSLWSKAKFSALFQLSCSNFGLGLSHGWPGALGLGVGWCGFGAGGSSFRFGKILVSGFRFFDSVSGAFFGGGRGVGGWAVGYDCMKF